MTQRDDLAQIIEDADDPHITCKEVADTILAAGYRKVAPDDDTIHAMATEMAHHHRLDPMTSRDRCTCGYKTPLGRLFSTHVAGAVLARLWQTA